MLGFSWCCRGQKKQGPNYFGAFGQHARQPSLRLFVLASWTALTNLLFAPIAVPHSSFLVLCPLLLQHPPPIYLQLLFINQRHFCSFLICYLFCLVNNSPWSHTLATSFVVVWSKLRACPSSSVVMAKIQPQLRFLRGAPSFWLGLSSSSFSSPAL